MKTLLKHREKKKSTLKSYTEVRSICILKNQSDIQGNLPSLRCNDLFGGNCENGNIITLAHHNPRQNSWKWSSTFFIPRHAFQMTKTTNFLPPFPSKTRLNVTWYFLLPRDQHCLGWGRGKVNSITSCYYWQDIQWRTKFPIHPRL